MNSRLMLLLFATAGLFFNNSCKDDQKPKEKSELEKLPPITQEGKNTFGCLLNGKAWIPHSSTDGYATYQSGVLNIYATLYNPIQEISLVLLESQVTIETGTYNLTNVPGSTVKYWIEINGGAALCEYVESNTTKGSLTITKLDKTNHIVSGQFEFDTGATGCDSVHITNGRFDLEYAP